MLFSVRSGGKDIKVYFNTKVKLNFAALIFAVFKIAMLLFKIRSLVSRIAGGILEFPRRLRRLWEIVVGAGNPARWQARQAVSAHRAIEGLFLLLDLLLIPELYETCADLLKWKSRPLSDEERRIARSVFGDALPLDRIRVDETARAACRSHHIIYVSFFTINAWGPIRPTTFIHELVHVWQYREMGSLYIPRALKAQRTKEAYNYGGLPALLKCMDQNGSLWDFNLEQQADIVADYYCIREGLPPHWGKARVEDLLVYEFFIKEIRKNTIA